MTGRYFLQFLAGALHEVVGLQGLCTYLLGVIEPFFGVSIRGIRIFDHYLYYKALRSGVYK